MEYYYRGIMANKKKGASEHPRFGNYGAYKRIGDLTERDLFKIASTLTAYGWFAKAGAFWMKAGMVCRFAYISLNAQSDESRV